MAKHGWVRKLEPHGYGLLSVPVTEACEDCPMENVRMAAESKQLSESVSGMKDRLRNVVQDTADRVKAATDKAVDTCNKVHSYVGQVEQDFDQILKDLVGETNFPPLDVEDEALHKDESK